MAEVRLALDRFGDDLWQEVSSGRDHPTIAVDDTGRVFHAERLETAYGQHALGEVLDRNRPSRTTGPSETPLPTCPCVTDGYSGIDTEHEDRGCWS
jgi:hypothetical protein